MANYLIVVKTTPVKKEQSRSFSLCSDVGCYSENGFGDQDGPNPLNVAKILAANEIRGIVSPAAYYSCQDSKKVLQVIPVELPDAPPGVQGKFKEAFSKQDNYPAGFLVEKPWLLLYQIWGDRMDVT